MTLVRLPIGRLVSAARLHSIRPVFSSSRAAPRACTPVGADGAGMIVAARAGAPTVAAVAAVAVWAVLPSGEPAGQDRSGGGSQHQAAGQAHGDLR